MKSDVFIETMNVDVIWEDHSAPETLLNKTSEEIQTFVLKALETELEKLEFSGTSDIESLEISLSASPENWKEELTEQLVSSITSEVAKTNPSFVPSNTNTEHSSWEVKTHIFFEQEMLSEEESQALWESLETYWSEMPSKFVSLFRTSASVSWAKMLKGHASKSFFEALFQSMRVSSQLAESYFFLSERISSLATSKNVAIEKATIEKLLIPIFVAPKDSDYILEEWAKEMKLAYAEANPLIDRTFQTKHRQIFEQLQKATLRVESKEMPTAWLEMISKLQSSELQELIRSLTDAARDHSRLIRSLVRFFKEYTTIALNDFWVLYPSYLKRSRELAPVLQELRFSENRSRVPVLQQMVQQLEMEKKSVSKKEEAEMENSDIVAKYAGIVLLNPFLPTLFRKFDLLNEKNEWESSEAQIAAMYLLTYVASGSFELEEETWKFYAFIVGLDDDVEYQELEEEFLDEQFPQELLAQELEGLLQAVRENWRPMRNASFPGLRRDFLIREGTLKAMDDSNYELDMEPHALDVMLPLRNWGISPVMYSWMEAIIYVNWK